MTPRAAVSSVAATAAAASATSASTSRANPGGVNRAISCVEEEEELILPLGQMADRRQQLRDIAFLLPSHHGRWVLARRRRDSRSPSGHLISTSRLVPQQTGQMLCASAGHARRAFR